MDPQKQKIAISHYDKANTLYQQGKLSESEKSYRKAIKINRNFAEAYGNLGNVLKDLGRIKEATGVYRKALNIYPNHPLLLNNLGNMFQLKGDKQKAIKYFKESIKQDTTNPDSYNNLGNMLKDIGQFDDAEDCFNKSLGINPHSAITHSNLGSLLHCQGKDTEAIALLQKAIELDPNFYDAYSNIGGVFLNAHKAEEAIIAYRAALNLEPNNAAAHTNLGAALKEQGNYDESIICCQNALKIDPNFKEAHLQLGATFRVQGKLEEAISCIEFALKIDPNYKEAHQQLGAIFRVQGKLEEAISCIEFALKIDPNYTEAHNTLSFLKKFTEHDNQIRTMTALFKQKNIPDHQKAQLGFALGKAFEEIKNYDDSFYYMSEGNRLKRQSFEYTSKKSKDLFQGLIEAYSPSFFSSHQDIGCIDETPIFIIGMPRSGTSLVEQILSSHPQVHGAGELKDLSNLSKERCSNLSSNSLPYGISNFDNDDFSSLGKNYIKALREHSDTAKYITDKMPHNFLYTGVIKVVFPNAKIIHCIRDPMDNCLSIYKNSFGDLHEYAYDLTELGEYYRLYNELMNHMRNVLPGFIYDISYEKLVADQEKQSRDLLAHCKLPWDEACLSFHKTKRAVSTLSAAQVRKAIYTDSVALWKNYEKQLEPLRKVIYG